MVVPVEDVDAAPPQRTRAGSLLDWVERVGNRFPDPIVLFLAALALTWLSSHLLAGRDFGVTDPRTTEPLRVIDQLTLAALATFLSGMTQAFVGFPPLGMVLVMVIGVGVAERSGLVGGALRGVLALVSPRLLTPLVVVSGIAAHVLSDSATVIVVPLAGALFYVAGRHPLVGITAGFASLFGVMFANLFPSGLDAILAGFSESGARLIDPAHTVNPLNNYFVGLAIAAAAVPVTWWLVDRIVEPRATQLAIDGDPELMPAAPPLTPRERHGVWAAQCTALVCLSALVKGLGLGTLMSLVLPFGSVYLLLQMIVLLLWWATGLPLGIGARYTFP